MILSIQTTDPSQTGIYVVTMMADLGTAILVYGDSLTVQITEDPCLIVRWEDVTFVPF